MAGPPEKEIDWNRVDFALKAGCTQERAAAFVGIHRSTLIYKFKEKYGVDWTTYSTQLAQEGEAIVEIGQFQQAMKGNWQALHWLGKVRLGQKEPEPSNNRQNNITININGQLGSGVGVSAERLPSSDNTRAEFGDKESGMGSP